MTPDNNDSIAGVKIAVMVFSFLGAAVSLSYAKEMTRTQAMSAVAIGTITSVAATPLLLHYLNLPDTLDRAIAFFAGLAAMRAVPVALALVDRLKDIKLPWLKDPEDKP